MTVTRAEIAIFSMPKWPNLVYSARHYSAVSSLTYRLFGCFARFLIRPVRVQPMAESLCQKHRKRDSLQPKSTLCHLNRGCWGEGGYLWPLAVTPVRNSSGSVRFGPSAVHMARITPHTRPLEPLHAPNLGPISLRWCFKSYRAWARFSRRFSKCCCCSAARRANACSSSARACAYA